MASRKANRSQKQLFPGGVKADPNRLTPEQRQQLVTGCLNLCRKLARQASGYVTHTDVEDLESEAFLACSEAALYWQPDGPNSFWKPDTPAKFSTYAQGYIVERLKGLATEQQRAAMHLRGANFEIMADRDLSDDPDAPDMPEFELPNDADADLLVKLTEPARSIVRAIVFEQLTPDRIADQLGMPVKDVKLICRNAAKELARWKLKSDQPGLFDQFERLLDEADPDPEPVAVANVA